jgi:hypothetical protein
VTDTGSLIDLLRSFVDEDSVGDGLPLALPTVLMSPAFLTPPEILIQFFSLAEGRLVNKPVDGFVVDPIARRTKPALNLSLDPTANSFRAPTAPELTNDSTKQVSLFNLLHWSATAPLNFVTHLGAQG